MLLACQASDLDSLANQHLSLTVSFFEPGQRPRDVPLSVSARDSFDSLCEAVCALSNGKLLPASLHLCRVLLLLLFLFSFRSRP